MRRQAGLTLIELVAVVALMATVAMGGARAISTTVPSVRLAAAARTMAQNLRQTRAASLAEGIPLDAVFDAATATWSERTLTGAIRRVTALPPGVAYGTLPVQPRVRFSPTGTAENKTIPLTTGAATRQIIVNQRGRVRLT
jgi:prepilin-type N-terminal cleavage/methylation domain-containing protein